MPLNQAILNLGNPVDAEKEAAPYRAAEKGAVKMEIG